MCQYNIAPCVALQHCAHLGCALLARAPGVTSAAAARSPSAAARRSAAAACCCSAASLVRLALSAASSLVTRQRDL